MEIDETEIRKILGWYSVYSNEVKIRKSDTDLVKRLEEELGVVLIDKEKRN